MKLLKLLLSFFIIFELSLSAKISEDDISKELGILIEKSKQAYIQSKNTQEGAQKIYAILDPVFDFALMAKLSLGSKQYKSLSKKQQKEFTKAFEQKLKDAFVDKLQYYTDQKFKVGKVKSVKSRRIVPVWVVDGKKSYQIDYKFYKSKTNGWMVYDMVIVGIDVIQTYRNQFKGILEHKSFSQMMDMLNSSNIAPKK